MKSKPPAAVAFATPKEAGYGIWQEQYNGNFMYRVDTVTKLCFAVSTGMTSVDCAKVKRRPEWAPIITWLTDAPPPPPAPKPAK